MRQYLGRELKDDEVIHHIDGNKLNNEVENLDVMNYSQHKSAHSSLMEIGYELYKKGLIGYDKSTHRYFIKG